MYTVNFKKCFGISVILAAMLLSGCQTKSESLPSESSVASSEQPEESSNFSSEEEPPYSEPPPPFPAGRVYPDDELVPSEWFRVDTIAEVREKIDEVLKSDTSAKDPESTLPALMNKHVLRFDMFYDSLLPANWDAPYNSADFENPIYPLTSEYFSDLQSIYDSVYDTYKSSTAEELLHGYNGEPRLTEINGQIYKNTMVFPIWLNDPFRARSYIEITEKTENKCKFIWHYPDLDYHTDEYNQPESGYEFFYFEKTYTAEYIDGSWKLNSIVIDG